MVQLKNRKQKYYGDLKGSLKLMEKDLGIMGICLTPAAPRGINAISPSVIRIFLKNLLVWKFWEKVHAPRFSSFYLGTLGQLSMTEAKEIFDYC